MERIIYKTPAELDFYTLNYILSLTGDTIVSSTWSCADSSITISNPSFSNLATKAWIAGGIVGNPPAYVVNNARTVNRVIDRAIKIVLQQYNFIPAVVQKEVNQDLLDYTIDWTNRLNGDTIVASSWRSSDPALSVNAHPSSVGNPPITTTVWLSGGVTGKSYVVTNTVVTSSGRILENSFRVLVLTYLTG